LVRQWFSRNHFFFILFLVLFDTPHARWWHDLEELWYACQCCDSASHVGSKRSRNLSKSGRLWTCLVRGPTKASLRSNYSLVAYNCQSLSIWVVGFSSNWASRGYMISHIFDLMRHSDSIFPALFIDRPSSVNTYLRKVHCCNDV
jgi:hypothetical protein